MDTARKQLHLDDILARSTFSEALSRLDKAECLISLPVSYREPILHAFSGGEEVLLARDHDPAGEQPTLVLSRENYACLPLLFAHQEQLLGRYGCRGLCLGEGRLVSADRSAPLLLHPVALVSRGEQWFLRPGTETVLHNRAALSLLPEDCPMPQEGWSYQGSVLERQLDAAIAGKPGCVREEGLYLTIFPLWALELEDAADRPLPKRSLAAGLEAGSVRILTDVPDCLNPSGEDALLTPLPLDGTQMTALRLLTQGEHLLVSGKRGTGKTQLAAALAANAMGSRQRTLIVAPRAADRTSMMERMAELGLDRLCLNIPSTGNGKNAVLHQYNVATQLKAQTSGEDFFALSQQVSQLTGKLDRHFSALHTPVRCGLTPWELICRYLEDRDAGEPLPLPEGMVSQLDQEGLERCLEASAELVGAAKAAGNVIGHPLSFIQGSDYPAEEAHTIPLSASRLHSAMKELEGAGADWCGFTGQSFPVYEADWHQAETAARQLQEWISYPMGWRTSPRIAMLPDVIHELRTRFDRAEVLQRKICEKWEDEVFRLDALLLEKQWRSHEDQWKLPTEPDREETLYRLLSQSEELLKKLEIAGRRWAISIHAPVPDTRESWERNYEVAMELARWKEIPREWGSCSALRALLLDVSELIRHGKQAKESKEVLLRSWDEGFLKLNGRELLRRWQKEGGSWTIGWLTRQSALRSEVEGYCKESRITMDTLENGLRWLVDFQDELSLCDEIYHRWEPELRSVYKGEETVWIWLENARVVASESHDWLAELTGSQDFLRKYGSSAEAVSAAQSLQLLWEQARDVLGRMNVIVGRPPQPDSPGWLEQRRNDCRRLHTLIKLRRQLEDLSKAPITLGDIAPALRLFSLHQQERTAIASLYERWASELEGVYYGIDTDWDLLYRMSLQAQNSDETLASLTGDLELRHRLAPSEAAQTSAAALCSCWAAFQKELDHFARLTSAQLGKGSGSWLNLLRGNVALILEHLPQLESWMNWNRQRSLCRSLNLDAFVDHYARPIPDGEDTAARFRKSLYRALLLLEMERTPALGKFSARQLAEQLRSYARLDEHYTACVRSALFRLSVARIPELFRDEQYKEELGLLLWSNQSQGQTIIMDDLIQSLPQLTEQLFPCVLASPTDALHLFPSYGEETPQYDYLIIDGADRLPASVGQQLLALGKTCLLISHGRKVDYPMFSDEESIWSRCAQHKLPRLELTRSYLLRQESLHWLDNQLFGLRGYPTCEPRAFHIQYKTVVGQMAKSANPAEAAAVAAHALSLLKDEREALAVVALTPQQRDLIDRLLLQFAAEEPELLQLLPYITVSTPDGLGSRRWNRVLLSLTLASGRKENFSAARKLAGSWTDLDPITDTLASTRQALILFSSMDRSDWKKLRNGQLSAFLSFAQDQTMPAPKEVEHIDPIRREVCQALAANGYTATPSEGPLAIRIFSPQAPDRCLLGVLMDGREYGRLPRAKERELDRVELLQKLGWNLCRLWSIDWLQDRERVLSQLLRLLQTIQEQEALPAEKSTAEAPESLPLYTPTLPAAIGIRDNELSAPSFRSRVSYLAEQVLLREAPVSPAQLTDRVLTAFDLDPQDEELRLQCDILWHRLDLLTTQEGELSFIWHRETPPDRYTSFRVSGTGEHYRSPDQVSAQEAANASAAVLGKQVTLTPLRLAQETARLLGYDPEDAEALACGKRGLDYALEQGRFSETSIGTLVLS